MGKTSTGVRCKYYNKFTLYEFTSVVKVTVGIYLDKYRIYSRNSRF